MTNTIPVLLFFVLYGCSTKFPIFSFDNEDEKVKEEKIVKDFKVDKAVLDKFTEKTYVAPTQPTKPEVSERLAPMPGTTKIVKKSPIIKPTVKPVQKTFPKDYPEKFKEYNKMGQQTWSTFTMPKFEGEEIVMSLDYMGMTMGHITFVCAGKKIIGNQETLHFGARMKTSNFYDYIYSINNQLDVFVEPLTLKTIKYSMSQRESKQDIDDLQLFDHDKFETISFYHRKTKDKEKKKQTVSFIPTYFVDPFSLLYFVRGLPFKDNETYTIPIVNKGIVSVLNLKLEGREELQTSIGLKKALRLVVEIAADGDTLKKGNVYFWLSDDADRVFLKLQGQTKMGVLKGQIEKWQPSKG